MLKPAICYKEELEKALTKYFYTNDMLYYMGYIGNSLIEILDESDNGNCQTYQFAVVNGEDKLIGYLSYSVDYYSSCAYNFGAFSFDRGTPIMGKEMFDLIEKLITQFHRVEFRAISGNPAVKGYDKLLQRHSDIGKKHILKDAFKDTEGNYHDDYIYEFVNTKNMEDK